MPEAADDIVMRVTIRDVYGEVTKISSGVEEVRRHMALLTQSAYESGQRMEDHEKRIRFLEKAAYAIPATLLIAIVGAAIQVIR